MRGTLIAGRIVKQVLLMVLLCLEEGAGRSFFDRGGDGLSFWRKVFLLYLLGHTLGDVNLFRRMGKDGGAILGAAVVSLSVLLRGIMATVEELDQLCIRHPAGIEADLRCLCVACPTSADLLVSWVLARLLSTDVAHLGVQQAFVLAKVFAKDVLRAPKAAAGKGGQIRAGSSVAVGLRHDRTSGFDRTGNRRLHRLFRRMAGGNVAQRYALACEQGTAETGKTWEHT